MQMPVMFRFPVKKTSDFSIEVQIPTGESGVPILHGEFIELYRLDDEEIKKAQMAALRSVAIMPAYVTERAMSAMQAEVLDREAELGTKKPNGDWKPVVIEGRSEKTK